MRTLYVDLPENVPIVAEGAREMLKRNHIKRDYDVVVPLELLARAEESKRIWNIVLGSIAGISLLVGGIGIMNVMLATVTERTREIGVLQAIGWSKAMVLRQILVEGVVVCLVGGVLGVGLGVGAVEAISNFTSLNWVAGDYASVGVLVPRRAPRSG